VAWAPRRTHHKEKDNAMAHLLAAVRHVRTSVDVYWPASVIGLGLAASLAWSAMLLYLATGLVENLTVRLVENLTH
jgi:hypothetical protein